MRYHLTDAVYLSTDHAQSSYGIPLLIVGDDALGPADTIPGQGIEAGAIVDLWASLAVRTREEKTVAYMFFASLPAARRAT